MTQLLDEAVDALERRLFFDQFNTRFGELQRDATVWAEIEAERALEHGAAGDQGR
jgi:hypothetical protein